MKRSLAALRAWIVGAGCALLFTGCVVSPYHSERFENRTTPIPFEIWATKANATLTITCSHHWGNTMPVTTLVGGSNPVTYAGDTMYLKKQNIVLPSGCWEPWGGDYITYIRVKQDNNYAAVFDEPGLDCLWAKIGAGEPPMQSGLDCKRDGPDILLYANY